MTTRRKRPDAPAAAGSLQPARCQVALESVDLLQWHFVHETTWIRPSQHRSGAHCRRTARLEPRCSSRQPVNVLPRDAWGVGTLGVGVAMGRHPWSGQCATHSAVAYLHPASAAQRRHCRVDHARYGDPLPAQGDPGLGLGLGLGQLVPAPATDPLEGPSLPPALAVRPARECRFTSAPGRGDTFGSGRPHRRGFKQVLAWAAGRSAEQRILLHPQRALLKCTTGRCKHGRHSAPGVARQRLGPSAASPPPAQDPAAPWQRAPGQLPPPELGVLGDCTCVDATTG